MASIKILPADLKSLVKEILIKSKVDPEESDIIAEILVWTDLVGRYPQGVCRLPNYLKRFRHGLIISPCDYSVERESGAVCVINGNNGFGQYVGHVAMLKAVDLAKQYGVGAVGVCNSNHFGANSYYIERIVQNGQMGIAVSNSAPLVAPYGGISAVFGTNPFAFGAPTPKGQSVLVDFSTGAIAGSTIRKALASGTNIPEGLVVDKNGKSIVDPKEASKGVILPFGGAKGFCMGLMVEILSSVITGAAISHEVASIHNNFDRYNNVGHFFIALDISKFMPLEDYYDRMAQLIGVLKEAKVMKDFHEILLPGETRWRILEKQKKEGIELDSKTINALSELAEKCGVASPW